MPIVYQNPVTIHPVITDSAQHPDPVVRMVAVATRLVERIEANSNELEKVLVSLDKTNALLGQIVHWTPSAGALTIDASPKASGGFSVTVKLG